MNTITLIYKVRWEVVDHWYNESDRCIDVDSDRAIDKIFYESDDAEKYMNSIPNQSYPPDFMELIDNPDEYEFATGFYLIDEQYPIE